MTTIAGVTAAYVRHYTDNGQTTAYVEWTDTKGKSGRTEGAARHDTWQPIGEHMRALFARAEREHVPLQRQTW